MLRQPLQATTTCTGSSTTTTSRADTTRGRQKSHPSTKLITASKKNSSNPPLSLVAAGRENQGNMQQQQQQLGSKKRKNGMKSLLGGVLDRFQRTSTVARLEDIAQLPLGVPQQQHNNDELWKQQQQQDPSQTTVQSDTEHSTPSNDASNEMGALHISLVVALPESADDTSNSSQQRLLADQQQRHASATIFQALVRGYRQRYEFQMKKLRLKLQTIQERKARQLAKLAHRTRMAKKAEKSSTEFRMGQPSRQLARTTRIIPYLFREAQAQLQENVTLLAATTGTMSHLHELQTSHMNLQRIAHDYLESYEDIPGIWQAMKAQWMGPKKARTRRGFAPDGRTIKLGNKNAPSRQYNTHDNDLPASSSTRTSCPLLSRTNSNNSNKSKDGAVAHHEGLVLMAELYLSNSKQVSESLQQVQALAESSMLN